MAEQRVRIGLVGAGKNTRDRHAPGFRRLPDVELIGVVNSTPESTARVARELEISKTYQRWQELVADAQIDAVCIGTWPNLHCEICFGWEPSSGIADAMSDSRTAHVPGCTSLQGTLTFGDAPTESNARQTIQIALLSNLAA